MSIRFRSISLVALLTLLTNILGFGREILTARAFGTSAAADAFVTAFTVVAVFFLIFTAGTVQGAFMPRYQSLVLEGFPGKAKWLFLHTLKLMGWLLLFLVALLFFGAKFWVKLIVPGFTPEKMQMTCHLIQIMAPMVILVGIGSLLQSVLHAYQKFIGPALVPVLNNIVVISVLLLLVPKFGVAGLAGGFTLGSTLWLVVLLPLIWPNIKNIRTVPDQKQFKTCLVLVGPLLILLLIDQISGLVQKGLVSGLETGAIAALSYAAKLEGLPVGIFAAAVSIVMFPSMVEATAPNKNAELVHKFYSGLELIIVLCLPFTLYLCLSGDLIVRVLFQRGAFNALSTQQTSMALFYYALGLVAQGLIIFINKVYFALSNTKTPMFIGTFSALVHILFCYFAVKYFGYLGIAAGTTVYALCYMVLLICFLKQTLPFRLANFAGILIRSLLATILSLLIYYLSKGWFTHELLQFFCVGVAILIFYLSYFFMRRVF